MKVVEDVACTVCGCVCDDLQVSVDHRGLVEARGACSLAQPWFACQSTADRPPAEIDGRDVPLEEALTAATNLLRNSCAPLIFGLSRSSTDGQRAAVRLADHIGACIDTTASICHGSSIVALQTVGESTCSLGEIRNRADLVVYWACDPVTSHPRHLERYSWQPRGMFIPGGAGDRKLIVVDDRRTPTAELSDEFVQINPHEHFEALWSLRSLVRGIRPDAATRHGASLDQLARLAERMKSCRCGVLFFGTGLSRTKLGHLHVEALLRLVTELNAHTRFHARRMRLYGDVAGADSVLCWQTGFPFCVNLSRGYPRYNPDEYSAEVMLTRGEADLCLLIGSEAVPEFSVEARGALRQLPIIAFDYPGSALEWTPRVRFTTAVYGMHRPGTAYRMDEVPIPLRPFLSSRHLSDAEVLQQLLLRVSE